MTEKEHGSVAMGDSREEALKIVIKHDSVYQRVAGMAEVSNADVDEIEASYDAMVLACRAALSRPVQEPVAYDIASEQRWASALFEFMCDFGMIEVNFNGLTLERSLEILRENYACDDSDQIKPVAIGFMRPNDQDGNSFWVHREKSGYYSFPVYAAPQPAHGTSATERVSPVNLEGSPPKLPPYSQSAFPHGFHELWTERQMRKFARDTAAFWINDFLEKAAQIVERYGADPWIARDIRALAALEGSSGHTAQSPKSEIDEAGNTGWMTP